MIYRNGIIKMKDRGIMICCLSDDRGVDGISTVISGLSCEMMKLGQCDCKKSRKMKIIFDFDNIVHSLRR